VIVAAGGNIVLNALLIPPFGTLGAAMATAATFLLWNVLLNIKARRLLGIDCSIAGWHEGN
jgi:O-antigen/teichoic acid export membrane protein